MHPIAAVATMMKQKAADNTITTELNVYFGPKVTMEVMWHPGSKKVQSAAPSNSDKATKNITSIHLYDI